MFTIGLTNVVNRILALLVFSIDFLKSISYGYKILSNHFIDKLKHLDSETVREFKFKLYFSIITILYEDLYNITRFKYLQAKLLFNNWNLPNRICRLSYLCCSVVRSVSVKNTIRRTLGTTVSLLTVHFKYI